MSLPVQDPHRVDPFELFELFNLPVPLPLPLGFPLPSPFDLRSPSPFGLPFPKALPVFLDLPLPFPLDFPLGSPFQYKVMLQRAPCALVHMPVQPFRREAMQQPQQNLQLMYKVIK